VAQNHLAHGFRGMTEFRVLAPYKAQGALDTGCSQRPSMQLSLGNQVNGGLGQGRHTQPARHQRADRSDVMDFERRYELYPFVL